MNRKTRIICLLIAALMLAALMPAQVDPSMAASKKKVTVTIGGKQFTATFENNKTAKAFMKRMPETYKMSKLNGNEIYKYVDYTLPKKAKKVGKVHKGDIMLYGNDCIVIFYKTFRTSYKYTKIGHISNTSGLKKAVSKKRVKVRFAVKGAAQKPAQQEETMKLKINDREISVLWEDNASVRQLQELAKAGPLRIDMSMYGGFEQVGSIGSSVTRADQQMTTQPGDIVLYSGNQVVVFYGSNSWSYTKLGKIQGLTREELTDLLGNGNVILTISL